MRLAPVLVDDMELLLDGLPQFRAEWETTTALSMPWATKMRRVIWPQAWALMLPGFNNLMVMLVKGTAVVGGRRMVAVSAEYTHWFGESWGPQDTWLWTGSAWQSVEGAPEVGSSLPGIVGLIALMVVAFGGMVMWY